KQMMLEGLEIFKTNKTCNLKTSLLKEGMETGGTESASESAHIKGFAQSEVGKTCQGSHGKQTFYVTLVRNKILPSILFAQLFFSYDKVWYQVFNENFYLEL
ncbi:hypothetical protein DBR06_SOUSAS6610224, partial [Sousa chinensis]